MGVLLIVAGLILLGTALLQAADARGHVTLRSYPFLRSQSVSLKWAYVGWLIVGGIVAIAFGLVQILG